METFMKKTYLMMASALVLTMAVAATAEARDGFYIAARGGYTDFNVNSKEDNVSTSAKVELGSGWHASGAIGYKKGYFRLEGEYIYRDDSDDEYPSKTTPGAGHKTVLESDSFMANAYLDIMPNYWISPYITGGIGLTRLDLENTDFASGGMVSNKETDSANNFTWQVGAGLSLRLNRCLNLDAGYRYIDMGEIDDADMNAHEWYGGLRYTF
ncbi:MAG: porin family protein [Alphaproteobacteria bacterium]|nr:porin family protein [Alphaproteobacteria bacterium]